MSGQTHPRNCVNLYVRVCIRANARMKWYILYCTTSSRIGSNYSVCVGGSTNYNCLVYVLKAISSTGEEEISALWNVWSWYQINAGWRNMRGWSSGLVWYNMRKQGAYIDILNIHRSRCIRFQELNIFIFFVKFCGYYILLGQGVNFHSYFQKYKFYEINLQKFNVEFS